MFGCQEFRISCGPLPFLKGSELCAFRIRGHTRGHVNFGTLCSLGRQGFGSLTPHASDPLGSQSLPILRSLKIRSHRTYLEMISAVLSGLYYTYSKAVSQNFTSRDHVLADDGRRCIFAAIISLSEHDPNRTQTQLSPLDAALHLSLL